jgi:hypothetical protein
VRKGPAEIAAALGVSRSVERFERMSVPTAAFIQEAVPDSLIEFMEAAQGPRPMRPGSAQRAGIAHARANDATAHRGRKAPGSSGVSCW